MDRKLNLTCMVQATDNCGDKKKFLSKGGYVSLKCL